MNAHYFIVGLEKVFIKIRVRSLILNPDPDNDILLRSHHSFLKYAKNKKLLRDALNKIFVSIKDSRCNMF